MVNSGSKNSLEIYSCKHCGYIGNKLSQWKRHIQTKKHKSVTMIKNDKNLGPYHCPCGKVYKFLSGLSRHKNTCKLLDNANMEGNKDLNKKNDVGEDVSNNTIENIKLTDNDTVAILKTLINENKKLHDKIDEIQGMIPNTGNTINSNNKIINVQMFLDEKCANAMTIQNFVKTLQVSLSDLDKNKTDCITNIVLKTLQPLAITERPIHCLDVKNKAWFIKDEKEGWEEDNGEKLIQKTEFGIMQKLDAVFENSYPNWMQNDKLKDKYVKLAGSTSTELSEKMKYKLLEELGCMVKLEEN